MRRNERGARHARPQGALHDLCSGQLRPQRCLGAVRIFPARQRLRRGVPQGPQSKGPALRAAPRQDSSAVCAAPQGVEKAVEGRSARQGLLCLFCAEGAAAKALGGAESKLPTWSPGAEEAQEPALTEQRQREAATTGHVSQGSPAQARAPRRRHRSCRCPRANCPPPPAPHAHARRRLALAPAPRRARGPCVAAPARELRAAAHERLPGSVGLHSRAPRPSPRSPAPPAAEQGRAWSSARCSGHARGVNFTACVHQLVRLAACTGRERE